MDSSVPRNVLLTGEYCGVPPSLVWYMRTHPTRDSRSGLLCIKGRTLNGEYRGIPLGLFGQGCSKVAYDYSALWSRPKDQELDS